MTNIIKKRRNSEKVRRRASKHNRTRRPIPPHRRTCLPCWRGFVTRPGLALTLSIGPIGPGESAIKRRYSVKSPPFPPAALWSHYRGLPLLLLHVHRRGPASSRRPHWERDSPWMEPSLSSGWLISFDGPHSTPKGRGRPPAHPARCRGANINVCLTYPECDVIWRVFRFDRLHGGWGLRRRVGESGGISKMYRVSCETIK